MPKQNILTLIAHKQSQTTNIHHHLPTFQFKNLIIACSSFYGGFYLKI